MKSSYIESIKSVWSWSSQRIIRNELRRIPVFSFVSILPQSARFIHSSSASFATTRRHSKKFPTSKELSLVDDFLRRNGDVLKGTIPTSVDHRIEDYYNSNNHSNVLEYYKEISEPAAFSVESLSTVMKCFLESQNYSRAIAVLFVMFDKFVSAQKAAELIKELGLPLEKPQVQQVIMQHTVSYRRAVWVDELFHEMQIPMSAKLYAILMELYNSYKKYSKVIKLYEEFQSTKNILNTIVLNEVLYAHLNLKNMETVKEILTDKSSVVQESTLILFVEHYATEGNIVKATTIFHQLKNKGFEIPEQTYYLLWDACARAGDVNQLLYFLEEMKKDYTFNEETLAVLVNVFRTCKQPELEKKYWAMKERLSTKGLHPDQTGSQVEPSGETVEGLSNLETLVWQKYSGNLSFRESLTQDELVRVQVVAGDKILGIGEGKTRIRAKRKAISSAYQNLANNTWLTPKSDPTLEELKKESLSNLAKLLG